MNNEKTEEERAAYQRGYMAHLKISDDHRNHNKNALLDKLEKQGRVEEKEATFGGTSFTYRHVSRSPQWEIRQGRPPESLDECTTATLEALILQGGINAWDGDGVSCVAQMIWAMHKRAEKAEAEVKRLKDKYEPED